MTKNHFKYHKIMNKYRKAIKVSLYEKTDLNGQKTLLKEKRKLNKIKSILIICLMSNILNH